MTRYSLFLDDERFPPEFCPKGQWVTARTTMEACMIVKERGMPEFISFDHDLGESIPSGHDFTIWLVESHLDGDLTIPANFRFYVHSQNPVGKANIEGLLNQFLEHIRNGEET